MKRITLSLLLLLLVTFSCSPRGKVYRIGVDPSFFPLELLGKDYNVFAFTNDLLKKIGRKERIEFVRITMSWDNVVDGLQKGLYEGILSGLPVNLITKDEFSFSDRIINTGSVLIVRQKEKVKSWKDMKGKSVAVEMHTEAAQIVESHKDVLIRFFESLPEALSKVEFGHYDGVMVPNLAAIGYIEDLYKGQLKIVLGPFGNDGLRLVTLKDEEPELMYRFNRGLDKLQHESNFKKLLAKWDLIPEKQ
ncbi:MAG: transporter substrate-binding domain-containing protein [Candidatus Algichlamydia australiensis]|nr:transporter substrate-binding domain-containing protein [Chlamydiales bacterium]